MIKKQIHEADTDSSNNNKNSNERKLFVGCLPKTLSRACLINHFSQYGHVSDFEFNQIPQKDGKSKLINAILTCSSSEMKNSILKQKNVIDSHKLKIVDYIEPTELAEILTSTRNRKIYIKRLPGDFDNTSLKEYFSKFGEVEKAYCVEGTRKRRGLKYGYIIFREEDTLEALPLEGFPYKGELFTWTSFRKKKEKSSRIDEEEEFNRDVLKHSENVIENSQSFWRNPEGSGKISYPGCEIAEKVDYEKKSSTKKIKKNENFRSKKSKKKKKFIKPIKKRPNLDHNLRPGEKKYHDYYNKLQFGEYLSSELKFRQGNNINTMIRQESEFQVQQLENEIWGNGFQISQPGNDFSGTYMNFDNNSYPFGSNFSQAFLYGDN